MALIRKCRRMKKFNRGGRKKRGFAVTKKRCRQRANKVARFSRKGRRISVRPFANFLRDFRKGKYSWPPSQLVTAAKKRWCKMSEQEKQRYDVPAMASGPGGVGIARLALHTADFTP